MFLKVRSNRKQEHSLFVRYFEVFHAPGVVEAEEIAQEGTAQTNAEAADKRIDLSSDQNVYRAGIHIACVEAVVFGVRCEPCPGCSEISEKIQLEGIEEFVRNLVPGDELDEGHAEFAAEQDEGCAVSDVLLEAAHVGGQRLVSVVLALVNPDTAVELRIYPVVHAAHKVNEARGTDIGGCRRTEGERHILIQFEDDGGILSQESLVQIFENNDKLISSLSIF